MRRKKTNDPNCERKKKEKKKKKKKPVNQQLQKSHHAHTRLHHSSLPNNVDPAHGPVRARRIPGEDASARSSTMMTCFAHIGVCIHQSIDSWLFLAILGRGLTRLITASVDGGCTLLACLFTEIEVRDG